ncbi:MAG: hypothetical protein IPJ22_04220 [Bacteroidetes bacterium]|nr:hypothetical protein [Bacteroidota bacterium]
MNFQNESLETESPPPTLSLTKSIYHLLFSVITTCLNDREKPPTFPRLVMVGEAFVILVPKFILNRLSLKSSKKPINEFPLFYELIFRMDNQKNTNISKIDKSWIVY